MTINSNNQNSIFQSNLGISQRVKPNNTKATNSVKRNPFEEITTDEDNTISYETFMRNGYGKAYNLKFSKESLERYKNLYGDYPEFE